MYILVIYTEQKHGNKQNGNEWSKVCQIDNCLFASELLFKYVTHLLLMGKMCEICHT